MHSCHAEAAQGRIRVDLEEEGERRKCRQETLLWFIMGGTGEAWEADLGWLVWIILVGFCFTFHSFNYSWSNMVQKYLTENSINNSKFLSCLSFWVVRWNVVVEHGLWITPSLSIHTVFAPCLHLCSSCLGYQIDCDNITGLCSSDPNTSSQCLHHSLHFISACRHVIVSHHPKKGEHSAIGILRDRDHIHITFIAVYYYCSILLLLLFISYCA